jgi:hypothetical protein
MSSTAAEVQRSFHGALLLAKGDTTGLGWLNLSFDGFWRSFLGPILATPAYALIVAGQYGRVEEGESGLGSVVFVEALFYAVDVACFPLLAILLTRYMGLGARYVPLIVATNWASLIQALIFVVAIVGGFILPPLRPMLMLSATLASLTYQWFVIRTSLGTTGGTAAAFLILNLLVGFGINRFLALMLQGG